MSRNRFGHEPLLSIEQIYDRNVAAEKLKHGTKYEQLAALVFQVLDSDLTIVHDVRLRGDQKKSLHQIDVHVTRADQSRRVLIECRDKKSGNKVGLDEARSFATVVRQLDAEGVMLTSSDFTQGARDLAEDEGLQLLTLRPFTQEDQEGRLMAIELTIETVMPIPDRIQVQPRDMASEERVGESLLVSLDATVVSGREEKTLGAILLRLMDAPLQGKVPQGQQIVRQEFDPPAVVEYEGTQIEIADLSLEYHVEVGETKIRIDAGARIAELVIRSLDGTFDRVIWNEELQQYVIDSTTKTVRRSRP